MCLASPGDRPADCDMCEGSHAGGPAVGPCGGAAPQRGVCHGGCQRRPCHYSHRLPWRSHSSGAVLRRLQHVRPPSLHLPPSQPDSPVGTCSHMHAFECAASPACAGATVPCDCAPQSAGGSATRPGRGGPATATMTTCEANSASPPATQIAQVAVARMPACGPR